MGLAGTYDVLLNSNKFVSLDNPAGYVLSRSRRHYRKIAFNEISTVNKSTSKFRARI